MTEPDTWTWPDAYADWPWPPEPEVDSESFLATCLTCGELYRKSAGLGVQCQECQWATDNIDPDDPQVMAAFADELNDACDCDDGWRHGADGISIECGECNR